MPRRRGSYQPGVEDGAEAARWKHLLDAREIGDGDLPSSERVLQRFHSRLGSHETLEPEAIHDRPRRAGDARGDTLEVDLLHAEGPGGPTEAHDAKSELGQARDARLVRDREPDLGRRLCADPVDAQGREEADDAARDPGAR